jgi:hypothetical protein
MLLRHFFRSSKFRIRLIEPDQLELFPTLIVKPTAVADTLFNFVRHVSTGNDVQLTETVPDEQYRTAMLKLLRNISPDGKRLKELQFYRDGGWDTAGVSIFDSAKAAIRDSLKKIEPDAPKEETLEGTLRALDLDKKWIEVLPPGSEEHIRCHAADIILDDVVGPMVNQNVIVTGVRIAGRRRMFRDIELAETP